jgi:hypothetical protein
MPPARWRMTDNAAICSWETYIVAGEHRCIPNFIREFQILRYWIMGSLVWKVLSKDILANVFCVKVRFHNIHYPVVLKYHL